MCWLRSKEIAQVLTKKWWQTYYPRDRDFPNPTEKKRLRRPSEPANHRKFLSRRSHGIRSKQSRRRENARQLGKHTGRYWNGRQNVFKDYHPRRIDSKQRNSPKGHLINSYKKAETNSSSKCSTHNTAILWKYRESTLYWLWRIKTRIFLHNVKTSILE